MIKRDQTTLDLWGLMCDYDLGKSNNKVVRDMYVFAYEVLVDGMEYVSLDDYSAKFIKLLTTFSIKFNKEDELRLIRSATVDSICAYITKPALIKFSWYLLRHKNFLQKWVYVQDTLSKTYNN